MTTGQAPKLREAPKQTVKAGTVGVMSGDLSRYAVFSISLINMFSYSGSKGHISHWQWLTGSNITGNCNDLAKGVEGDWLWMIGDDHVFHADILERLLSHDVDVIAPHCLQRGFPYPQVIYESEDHDSSVSGTHLVHTNLPKDGVVEVHAVGGAGLLIKKHVLEAIGEPYFETFGKQNEDLMFCRKVREAGFKIHVDVNCPLGHICNMIVWPCWSDQHNWGIRMNFGGDNNVFLPRIGPSGSVGPLLPIGQENRNPDDPAVVPLPDRFTEK